MSGASPIRRHNRVLRIIRRTVATGLLAGASLLVLLSPPAPGEARAANEDAAPVVTFMGLRVHKDGSSTLFVELTRTTPVDVEREGTNVSYLLRGAKVRWRNNKNPLLADHFGTNVVRAALEDSKAGVKLNVKLRETAPLDHEMGSSPVGARLRVDVPPLARN